MSDTAPISVSEPFLRSGRLTFNEAHIVIENVSRFQEKAKFLSYLNTLMHNTKDPCLLRDLRALSEKIKPLTGDQYQTLRKEADQSYVIFPPNYLLPNGG